MAWEIERDTDGEPMRLSWRRDPPARPVVHLCCPRCRSVRFIAGRCLDCWCHVNDGVWGRQDD